LALYKGPPSITQSKVTHGTGSHGWGDRYTTLPGAILMNPGPRGAIYKGKFYLSIPKNGSTLLVQRGEPITYTGNKLQRNYPVTVILREPTERWEAGILQWCIVSNNELPSYEELYEKVCFDEHTVPQSDYIGNIKVSEYISMEDLDSIFEFRTAHTTNKDLISHMLDDAMLARLREFYARDYELWEKIRASRRQGSTNTS